MVSKESEALSLFDFSAMIKAFEHPDGGVHESLDADLSPANTSERRALSQARMIYLASRIGVLKEDEATIARALACADALIEHWGGAMRSSYCYSRTEQNEQHPLLDLYAHAFVIFGFAWLAHASGETRFAKLAHGTLDFITAKMASPDGGFVENLDGGTPLPRRQNPHMHLLEALLALLKHGLDQEGKAQRLALELIELAQAKWIQPDGTLREYFTEDWQLDPERGHIVEVGHHFEWAWLLCEAADLLERPELRDQASGLYAMGQMIGYDHEFGGYFDEVTSESEILRSSKRIWPLCEAIKAGVKLGDERADRDFAFLREHYSADGWWIEHLDRELLPITFVHKATTPYHLLFAITEYAGV